MIYCYYCKKSKEDTEFTKSRIYTNTMKGKCKECQRDSNKSYRDRNPEKLKVYEQRRLRDPEVVYRYKLTTRLRRYNLSREDYEKAVQDQKGCCKICMKFVPENKGILGKGHVRGSLHIDHCHESGEVRGLLCRDCNIGLGCFGDSMESLYSAIRYLRAYDKLKGIK